MKPLARNSAPVKDGIDFGPVELCAIDMAFKNPNNSSPLTELRKKFPAAYTDSQSRYFEDATGMSFKASLFASFLRKMVSLLFHEIGWLKSEPNHSILSCGHKAEDHQAALISVIRKVSLGSATVGIS